MRPLLREDGRLPELSEEVVVDRPVLVEVEVGQSQPGFVHGLLEGVRTSAHRRPGERKSGRAVPVSGDHEQPEFPDTSEVSGHLDDGPETGS